MFLKYRRCFSPTSSIYKLLLLFFIAPITYAHELPDYESNEWKTFKAKVDYSYFNKNFDFLGFQKTSTTSSLENETKFTLVLNYKLTSAWIIQTGFSDIKSEASRQSEPYKISGNYNEYWGAIQWQHNSFAFRTYVKYAHYSPQKFYRYQYNQILFGRDVVLLDPDTGEELPILKTQMSTLSIGADIVYDFILLTGHLQTTVGYEYSTVDSDVKSKLFDVTDPFFLDSKINGVKIRDTIEKYRLSLPQNSTWKEHILNTSLNYNYKCNEHITFDFRYTYYYVMRENYQDNLSHSPLHSNSRLDIILSINVMDHLNLYMQSQAMSNYLLGIQAGAYNRRTSHLFENPFGYIHAGLVVDF